MTTTIKWALIVFVVIALGLGGWTFYNRIIKNVPTTYQRADRIDNPDYHNDFHPICLIGIGGCTPEHPLRAKK
jgi:hypothetical protein